ncbi:MAG: hypothetical protein ACC656_09725, partial [Candidatus Heimdallarchaeota archaeon]
SFGNVSWAAIQVTRNNFDLDATVQFLIRENGSYGAFMDMSETTQNVLTIHNDTAFANKLITGVAKLYEQDANTGIQTGEINLGTIKSISWLDVLGTGELLLSTNLSDKLQFDDGGGSVNVMMNPSFEDLDLAQNNIINATNITMDGNLTNSETDYTLNKKIIGFNQIELTGAEPNHPIIILNDQTTSPTNQIVGAFFFTGSTDIATTVTWASIEVERKNGNQDAEVFFYALQAGVSTLYMDFAVTNAGALTHKSDVFMDGNSINDFSFITSNAANVPNNGAIRLGNNERITWRNAANTQDILFGLSGSDSFFFSFNFVNRVVISDTVMIVTNDTVFRITGGSFIDLVDDAGTNGYIRFSENTFIPATGADRAILFGEEETSGTNRNSPRWKDESGDTIKLGRQMFIAILQNADIVEGDNIQITGSRPPSGTIADVQSVPLLVSTLPLV